MGGGSSSSSSSSAASGNSSQTSKRKPTKGLPKNLWPALFLYTHYTIICPWTADIIISPALVKSRPNCDPSLQYHRKFMLMSKQWGILSKIHIFYKGHKHLASKGCLKYSTTRLRPEIAFGLVYFSPFVLYVSLSHCRPGHLRWRIGWNFGRSLILLPNSSADQESLNGQR